MATVSSRTCDVFISHAAADSALAMEIAAACRANGLEALTNAELGHHGEVIADELWDALAESRALLLILAPAGPTASMAFELGAAKAWNKPVFGIVTDPSARLPSAVSELPLFTSGRIDEVIGEIQRMAQQLTEQDRRLLSNLYRGAGASVDQLALDPATLNRLVRDFKASTGKIISGERLLSELLRLRKQAKLGKTRHK